MLTPKKGLPAAKARCVFVYTKTVTHFTMGTNKLASEVGQFKPN